MSNKLSLKDCIISAIKDIRKNEEEYIALQALYVALNMRTNNEKAAIRGNLNKDFADGQIIFQRSPEGGAYRLNPSYVQGEVKYVAKRVVHEKTLLEMVEEKMARDRLYSVKAPTTLLEEVEASRTDYILKEEIFNKFLYENRDHQKEALSKIIGEDIGQIIIPTGTGKTRVQIAIHIQDMIDKFKAGKRGVYVIGAHRLLLCRQLMNELQDLCLNCGIPINVLYIGSARYDEKDVFDKYFKLGIDDKTYESFYTTSGKDVKKFYEKTMAVKRNLIVVSTYHSFDRLINIENIDVSSYDEAHNLTGADFTKNVLEVISNIKRNFYFTATRKTFGEDGGMNNEDMFGKVLKKVSPREMIDKGEIVEPKFHIVMPKDEAFGIVSNRNEAMLAYTLKDCFIEHKKRVKKDSAFPDKIGAKLLVSTKGSNEIELIQNNVEFQIWCRENNIKVFSFSSEYGNFENFKEEPNRNKVYESMRNLGDEEDCILLHIDILTEGIDLPSITGVLPLRNLNEIKLFQSTGRALRLLKSDRIKLYKGEMKPSDKHLFTKPYAYVILPMHFEKMDESSADMKATLKRIINEYEIPTEEFLPPEIFDGVNVHYLDPVTDHEALDKREKMYPLYHAIEDLMVNNLEELLPIDPIEREKALFELLD
jgi:superfamily II DNA or RNA helicase